MTATVRPNWLFVTRARSKSVENYVDGRNRGLVAPNSDEP